MTETDTREAMAPFIARLDVCILGGMDLRIGPEGCRRLKRILLDLAGEAADRPFQKRKESR